MVAESDSFAPMNRVVSSVDASAEEEARSLLQRRLAVCSLVLVAAFVVFFIQGSVVPTRRTVHEGLRGLAGAVLMLAAGYLNGSPRLPIARLRSIEAALFGGLAVYMAFDLYSALRIGVLDPDVDVWRVASFLKSDLACVTALIFTYAIFIPNGWRRALAFISAMALAPLIAALILYANLPEFRQLVGREAAMTLENLGEHLVLLATSVATSVFGVWTINDYRMEAARLRKFNQYQLIRKLGAGGMGEVFLAEHNLLKRPCALKLISDKLVGKEVSQARFELEVRATARLSHWNTVEVFDYGRTEDGDFFYVMEYLPGLSLQELVDRHGPMPAARIIYLLRQVCEALREAHLAGLIHRDLKPPNIFVAYRGARYDVAKVLDFGLVKEVVDTSPHLTLEGVVTGSPLYMAPELILKNRTPDGRVDVYSLGAVAYYLVTGRPPFLGTDAMSVMLAHAHDPVEPISGLNKEVPADLEEVILRCLEKHPRDRFADVEALSRALAACDDAGGWSADRAEEWWKLHEPILPAADPGQAPASESSPSLGASAFRGVEGPETEIRDVDPLMTIGEEPQPPADE